MLNRLSNDQSIRARVIADTGILFPHKEDKSIQDIITLASFSARCPMAFFSVITDTTQYLKSAFGFVPNNIESNDPMYRDVALASCSKDDSFCIKTLELNAYEPLIIPDTHKHDDLCKNKFVVGEPFLRFYGGFPVRLGGVNIGAMCVTDVEPKVLAKHEVSSLFLLREQLELILGSRLDAPTSKPWYKRIFGSK